ncbi:hypothetical protein DPMN_063771 [Dreissena polymorpha]|uniref:Uncharacterized protein n=1 Tax=Dreissena polymorpha TaxID=45954 RepID=A0A9D4CBZ8_DREPO|nr:hypothetical protein DPMN_063771 [Dreissena polymorpha]
MFRWREKAGKRVRTTASATATSGQAYVVPESAPVVPPAPELPLEAAPAPQRQDTMKPVPVPVPPSSPDLMTTVDSDHLEDKVFEEEWSLRLPFSK